MELVHRLVVILTSMGVVLPTDVEVGLPLAPWAVAVISWVVKLPEVARHASWVVDLSEDPTVLALEHSATKADDLNTEDF